MKESYPIVVGKKDVKPDLPSHVPGVHEGNWPKKMVRRRLARGTEPTIAGDARRSTGISPSHHGTLLPEMPKLTPP